MAAPARAATSAISASSRTISRISSPWCARPQPSQPLTLLGHSAGGGFALRVASSPIQNLFARTVLLAPYLGYDAPTNRPDSGGWASPDIPRFLALAALHRLGIDCCEALPTLAFAVPPNSERILASTYSYRLMRNFATRGYQADLAAATRPLALIAGADDELMLADKYAEAVHAVAPSVEVKLIDGVNHMGIVSDPRRVGASRMTSPRREPDHDQHRSQGSRAGAERYRARSSTASGNRGSTISPA